MLKINLEILFLRMEFGSNWFKKLWAYNNNNNNNKSLMGMGKVAPL